MTMEFTHLNTGVSFTCQPILYIFCPKNPNNIAEGTVTQILEILLYSDFMNKNVKNKP